MEASRGQGGSRASRVGRHRGRARTGRREKSRLRQGLRQASPGPRLRARPRRRAWRTRRPGRRTPSFRRRERGPHGRGTFPRSGASRDTGARGEGGEIGARLPRIPGSAFRHRACPDLGAHCPPAGRGAGSGVVDRRRGVALRSLRIPELVTRPFPGTRPHSAHYPHRDKPRHLDRASQTAPRCLRSVETARPLRGIGLPFHAGHAVQGRRADARGA